MYLVTLERGRTRVVVAPEFGGRIAQFSVRDGDAWVPLLYEPPDVIAERDPLGWGSYVLVPWPNRIARGTFDFDDVTYRLPANDDGNALHGFGFTRAWAVDAATRDSCALSFAMPPEWPFGGWSAQRIEVFDDGVRQTVELHADRAAYPCGVGWHPWLRRDVRPGTAMRVLLDAGERYELDVMIPTGRIVPVNPGDDFRDYPQVGERRLDDCYRGVRGAIGVRWGDIELTMTSSANAAHAVVYSEHPSAVCVEPQTCAIDALNLAARGDGGAGVQVASPGAPVVAWTDWRWRIDG